MKRILFSLLAVTFATAAIQAQRLVIGEKAPEIKVAEWQDGRTPSIAGKAYVVDFFLSSNSQCIDNLPKLHALQTTHNGKLNVILISREGLDKVKPFTDGKRYEFYAGQDDNEKTFTGYSVRFVPFAALADARGRLVWTGNIASLTNEIIEKALK